MKNQLFTLLLYCFSFLISVSANSQTITYDPFLFGAVLSSDHGARKSWDKVHRAQKAITAAQTATTTVVNKLKQIQNKIYKGLTTVNSAVKDGYSVYYIGILIKDIGKWEAKMIKEAAGHPIAAAWAAKYQKHLIEKSTACISDISTFILKAKDDKLLMRAGERAQLLWNIKQELQVMKALAVTSYYAIHWVVMQGLINAVNPFDGYVNIDKKLMQDVLHTWKF